MALDHLEIVKEYAMIVRGEHPAWEGSSTDNARTFGFRIGLDLPDDGYELIRSLGIAETEYSLLTGLPPNSLRRFSLSIRRGIDAGKRQRR